MGSSVGSIWLNLEITNTIAKQLKTIAKGSEAQAAAAFKGVGSAISESIAKPTEQAGAAVQKSLKGTEVAVKKTVKAIKTETGALFADEVYSKKAAMPASSREAVARPKQEVTKKSSVKTADVTGLRASSDAVKLLEQELDNANAKIRLQEQEVDRLTTAYNGIPVNKLGGEEAKKLEAQLAAAEGKLLSMQRTAGKTGEQLKKAALDQSLSSMSAKGLQKRDNTLEKEITRQKTALESLEKEYDKAAKKKATNPEQFEALGKRIQEAKSRLTSLSSESEAVKKRLGASAEQPKSKFTGLGKKVKSVAAGMKKNLTNSVKAFPKTAAKSVAGVGKSVNGLAKSVKSAFKSAFLMAGLYAAFRGIKSLIGETVGQNEEFTKSLQAIKANLLVAFTPIVQAIQPALNALASGFAAVSKQIATVSAGLFGQTYNQAKAATKQMKSVGAEAKKASSSLSIDELNIVGSEDSESGADLSALDTTQYGDPEAFGQTLLNMLKKAAGAVGPLMSKIADGVKKYAPTVITAAADVVKSLLSGINDNAPAIIQSGISVLKNLIDGMKSVLPELGPFIVHVITAIISGFLTWTPNLIAMGITLLSSVLSGLAEKIPELIPLAQTAIMTIVQAITDNLPTIINAGMMILTSLIYGISDMIPTLIPMAMECILTLVEGLVDNLPALIDSAIVLITSLAQGLIDALPILIAKAPVIIKKLVDGLVDSIPKLVDAAIDIIMGLVDFLINNLPMIFESAVDIIMSLADGLVDAIPKLVAAVPKLIKALVDKIMSTDWLKVGGDIISGIGDGLMNGVKGIGNTIKKAASGIVNGFKSFFGIHSPSRLFRDQIGENLALGIGEGFQDEMGTVSKSMQKAIPVPALSNISVNTNQAKAGGSVAPLNTLVDMIGGARDPEVLNLLKGITTLLEAIKDKDLRLYIGDREIAQAANRGGKALGYSVVTG